ARRLPLAPRKRLSPPEQQIVSSKSSQSRVCIGRNSWNKVTSSNPILRHAAERNPHQNRQLNLALFAAPLGACLEDVLGRVRDLSRRARDRCPVRRVTSPQLARRKEREPSAAVRYARFARCQ